MLRPNAITLGGPPPRYTLRHAPPLPTSPDVRIESDQRVWSGRFPLDVIRFLNRRFDGAMSGLRTWEMWRRGRAVAMLPFDPAAAAVVLIEQFRFPAFAAGLDPVVVKLPAGLLEDGENPEETMHRELQEELAMTADRRDGLRQRWLAS